MQQTGNIILIHSAFNPLEIKTCFFKKSFAQFGLFDIWGVSDWSLKKKGLVKINNFKKNPKKLNYLYVVTPKGISEKTKLSIKFMQRKMKEYDELKNELEREK